MTTITDLDSQELANRIAALVGREREVQADFLLHLMEFDRRRDYVKAGYGSLWEYCHKKLGYPENATFRRTHAVKVLHRFPHAIDFLRDGRLSMTTLVLLEPALSPENAEQVFAAAFGKSKREVEEFLASRKAPIPVPAATIRKVPVALSLQPLSARPMLDEPGGADSPSKCAPEAPPVVPFPPPPRRPSVEPIAADQFRITMVVNGEFVEALKEAQLVLSHSIPSGDVAAVLRRALAGILEKHGKRVGTIPARRRATAASTPHPPNPSPKPRPQAQNREPIAALVLREIWRRDGGRCTWQRPDGGICGSRYQLELDHRVPCAMGGPSTTANLRLRCSAHNNLHAREVFGDPLMDRVSKHRTFPGKGPA